MKRRQFLSAAAILSASAITRLKGSALASALDAVAGRAASTRELRRLRARFQDRVILPADDAYEKARRVLSAKVDKHPSVILRCVSRDDVRFALDLARTHELPLAVRSGGHSLPGHGTGDGVVIDMARLGDVEVLVDRSIVRAGGGALVGTIDRATAPHGRATVLGECPSVGVSGFALGGGEGALMGKFGAGCDNIVAAEMVLANGRVVTASAESHPDLFWAIRGGGGNFGVITRLDLRIHTVTNVLAGRLVFNGARRADILRAWRDLAETIPDELTMILRVVPGRTGEPIIIMRVTYCGNAQDGQRLLAPLRTRDDVLSDEIKWQPYLDVQLEGPSDPTPTLDETRSGFLPRLTERAIDAISEMTDVREVAYMVTLAHLHGAISAPASDATAYPLRQPGFDCWITAEWDAPASREKTVQWVTGFWSRLASDSAGAYINGLEDEGQERIRAAYGVNFARLARIKHRYDPENVFRRNQNIEPDRRA